MKCECFFHIFVVAANGCLETEILEAFLKVSSEILKISRVHQIITSVYRMATPILVARDTV